jgi:xanthine dehydrogenase small subunit
MSNTLRFWLNDELIEEAEAAGTTTLLRYLRDKLRKTGTKEGCAEGDCGACSVVIVDDNAEGGPAFRAVNSCLVFLPILQGKKVYTVEALRESTAIMQSSDGGFHPVQEAMVATRGSQCGYCTPGIVMSLFEACYRPDMGADWQLDDQLCGNLCRCTGYRPIREAAAAVAGSCPADRFQAKLEAHRSGSATIGEYRGGGQSYFQPGSLEELWRLRACHPAAVLVAGATDLGLQVTKRHIHYDKVIGLEALPELKQLERRVGGWWIGAGVNLTRLMDTVGPEIKGLDKMMRVFGSRQIRSRATLGGNLCNASPIGDNPPMMIALGATAVIAGSGGTRRIPMEDFFVGYRQTALTGDEILLAVELPHLASEAYFSTYKVSKRRELDISICAAGMLVELDGSNGVVAIRLAYGGMAATPLRAHKTEAALLGKLWTIETIEAAVAHLDEDFQPISDHRGSARYRRLLAKNLLRGFFYDSVDGADGLGFRPVSTVAAAR